MLLRLTAKAVWAMEFRPGCDEMFQNAVSLPVGHLQIYDLDE